MPEPHGRGRIFDPLARVQCPVCQALRPRHDFDAAIVDGPCVRCRVGGARPSSFAPKASPPPRASFSATPTVAASTAEEPAPQRPPWAVPARSREVAVLRRKRLPAVREFVQHSHRPEWGTGIVVASSKSRVVVHFEQAGKKEVASVASLQPIADALVDRASTLRRIRDTLARPPGAQKRHALEAGGVAQGHGVLFANIGWSVKYDGSPVIGGHGWLRNSKSKELGCSEESLFEPEDGTYSGPLGRGRLPAVARLDVVFVARDPKLARDGHRVVALFRDVRIEAQDDGWLMATSRVVRLLSVRKRPLVKWPGRMSVRRWAKGSPRQNWPELLACYEELVAASAPKVRTRRRSLRAGAQRSRR